MNGIPQNYVLFTAPIVPETVNALVGHLAALAPHHEEIHLLLNSPGGSVLDGVHCYNVLRSLPVKLSTYNVGNVDSIANVIFLAGDDRFAADSAVFLFHGVGMDLTGPMRLEEPFLRERLQSIEADHDRIAGIMADRTKLTVETATGLFREQRVHGADWALDNGIIHGIKRPALPKDLPLVQIQATVQGQPPASGV